MFETKRLINSWDFEWVSQRRGWQYIKMKIYECSAFLECGYSLIEMERKDGSVFYSSKTVLGIMTKEENLNEYFFYILFAIILDSDFIGKGGHFSNDNFNERDWEIMRHFKWFNTYNTKLNTLNPILNYSINFKGMSEADPSLSYWNFIKTLNIKEWDKPEQHFIDLRINNNRAYLETRENKRIVHEFENPSHIFFFAKRNAYEWFYCNLLNEYYDGH